ARDQGPTREPDRRPAEQRREEKHGSSSRDQRRDLVAVEDVVTEVVVGERVGPDRGRVEHRALQEVEVGQQLDDLRDRDQQTDRSHELRDGGRGAEVPIEGAVQDQADQRRDDENRDDERRQQWPVVVGGWVVEDRGRDERLRPEGEVEHAGRLVRQDQPDRDEREDATERDSENHIVEEVAHSGGLPFRLGTAEPTVTPCWWAATATSRATGSAGSRRTACRAGRTTARTCRSRSWTRRCTPRTGPPGAQRSNRCPRGARRP